MPTYTYQCKVCGHRHDVFHAMNANPRVKCPECRGRCTRLIGAGAGIIFKGSGFYETDYKKSKDKKEETKTGKESAAETKPAAAGKSAPSPENKTGAKTESTSEPKSPTPASTTKQA